VYIIYYIQTDIPVCVLFVYTTIWCVYKALRLLSGIETISHLYGGVLSEARILFISAYVMIMCVCTSI